MRPDPAGAGAGSAAGSGGARATEGASGNGAAAGSAGAAGSSGGGGGAGGGGAKPVQTSCKQGRPGPEMVLIPKPDGAFCIDKTEVQRKHYAEFLKAVGEAPDDPRKDCKGNTSYGPNPSPKGCPDNLPASDPKFPEASIGCVDWCDARAFCEWAGKRLCDAPTDAAFAKPDTGGEWNLACSNGGKTLFPYGNQYEEARCHDRKGGAPADGATSFAPGTAPECHGLEGPHAALLDMSGGLPEWTARCTEAPGPGADATCVTMGGGWGDGVVFPGNDTIDRLSCWTPLEPSRLGSLAGIRCCADD